MNEDAAVPSSGGTCWHPSLSLDRRPHHGLPFDGEPKGLGRRRVSEDSRLTAQASLTRPLHRPRRSAVADRACASFARSWILDVASGVRKSHTEDINLGVCHE